MAKRQTPETKKSTAGELAQLKTQIERLQQEKEGLEKDNTALTEENEKLKAELRRSIVDSVTGLGKREQLFQILNREIPDLLGADWEELLASDFKDFDPDALSHAPLYVMMADVSYLSLVNSAGHDAGDHLLGVIGDSARRAGSPEVKLPQEDPLTSQFSAYRHGGDEISGIIRSGEETEARTLAKKFQSGLSDREIGVLKKSGLRPRLDFGLAHLSEAIRAYKLISRKEEIPADSKLKVLENIIIRIADRRSAIKKGVVRIYELIDLLEREGSASDNYQTLMGFLRKGAFGTTDRELAELKEQKDELAADEFLKVVVAHIKDKAEIKIAADGERTIAVEEDPEQETINEIADEHIDINE